MPIREDTSREDIVAETIDEFFRTEYGIIDSPIAALKLRAAMVLRIDGKLRVVISVRHEESDAGQVVIIKTSSGFHKVARKSKIAVWHIKGKPFIMTLPPEGDRRLFSSNDGGSAPPTHDAAGIVPVWRGPIRPN